MVATPVIRGWAELQAVVATASQRFHRPADGSPPMASAVFLGEPLTIGVARDADGKFTQLADSAQHGIGNLHVLINAFIPETGAVKIIAGNVHFAMSLLHAYYTKGFAETTYSIEFGGVHQRDHSQYNGPHINMRAAGSAKPENTADLELHELEDPTVIPDYLQLLSEEFTTLNAEP